MSIRGAHTCCLIVLAALTAGVARTARADTLFHKDGRVLRGRVEANGEKFYKLKLEHGSVTIKRSAVLKLEGGPAARAAYDQRLAGATPANYEAWMQLGKWCDGQGLDRRAHDAYRQAMAVDPAALEPLKRLSSLMVDDLVYRFVQASEDERGPILEQLRPHGERGLEGIQRAFRERMQLAKDHVAKKGVGGFTAGVRKEFQKARRQILKRVVGIRGTSYERYTKNHRIAHEIAYIAGRVIALAKRKNLREALKVDPFIDRHLTAADRLAGALREVAADAGKAAAEVEKLVTQLTDEIAKADVTSGVKASADIEAYNAAVRSHNKGFRDELSALEWQGIESVNWYRAILGLRMLKIEKHLMQAARKHTADMVRLKFFAHNSPVRGYREPWHRAIKAGYAPLTVGENLAQQRGAPLDGWGAMKAWIISPPHHRNMLKPGYVHVGIGAKNSTWTLNLGIPRKRQ